MWKYHEHGVGCGTLDMVPGATRNDHLQWLRHRRLISNALGGARESKNGASTLCPPKIARGRGCAFGRPFSLTDVFRVCAEARALLFTAGEFDFIDAVDALQASAIASGLVASIGQDVVQAIIAVAFSEVRRNV